MSKFIYSGMTSRGARMEGEIEAQSRFEAVGFLGRRNIRIETLHTKPFKLNFTLSLGSGVKLQHVSRFTRLLAVMTGAGLPLLQCLEILGSQTESSALAGAIRKIVAEIQAGNPLSDALGKHPRIFSKLYCNMVSAGEASGNLDGVLVRLAEYLEKAESLRRKITTALTYPAVVGIVAGSVTIAMLTFIVPSFSQMFADLGGKLPLPTLIVMGISDFLQKYLLFIVVALIGFLLLFMRYSKTSSGKYALDVLRLRMPLVGDLERKSCTSRFAQTLSTLLSSGVPLLDALSITAKTSDNKVIEKGLLKTLEKISGGRTLAEPLKETGVFSPLIIQMIAVGEKTGDLSAMLTKISDFYKEEVDAAVDALTAIVEPIMIVFLGAAIGGILIAMYLPIFNVMGSIK